MILLPYVHTITSVNQIPVHSYMILTIGGKQLWIEDLNRSIEDPVEDLKEESVEQILVNNDLYVDSITQHGDVYLCRINTEKTKMADFYKWSEITDPDTFCWRTLYTFGEQQNWLPHPPNKIGTLSYQTICTLISEDITI
jgi:hypothetical protein